MLNKQNLRFLQESSHVVTAVKQYLQLGNAFWGLQVDTANIS